MTGPVIRNFDARVDSIDREERSLVAKINTCGKDRYNTVILPSGGKFDNYNRNRVVLWEHGKDPRRFTDPIGKNKWIRNGGGHGRDKPATELLAKTFFLEDEFSDQRFEWYRDGTLSAFSVSALPKWEDSGPPTPAELRGRPDWEGATNIFRSWELAEYSGTAVPGNADTLVAGRASTLLGLVQRDLLWLPDDARELIESRAGEAEAVERKIVSEGGKFYVYSEDGKKKLGGPYKTKEEAEKRLKQVEYFKHEGEHKDKEESPRSAPYIDTDGQAWTVRSADGTKIAAFADARIAEICLAELGRETLVMVGGLMQRNHMELMGQFDEIRRDLKNEIALRMHGVV